MQFIIPKSSCMYLIRFCFSILLLFLLSACSLDASLEKLALKSDDIEKTKIPHIRFKTNSYVFSESDSNKTFRLFLEDEQGNELVATEDISFTVGRTGSAVVDTDYSVPPQVYKILKGTSFVDIRLNLIDNNVHTEPEKSLNLTIASDFPNIVVEQNTVEIKIQDDELKVMPFYPTNGADWNSYVQSVEGGQAVGYFAFTRYLKNVSSFPADVNCTTSFYCNHGGELKKVEIFNKSSCQNLTMADSEDAFEWRCNDHQIPIFFYSVGFKKGKGLGHLIQTATPAWKNLSVSLKVSGSTVKTSSSEAWWTNSIQFLNSSNINAGASDAKMNLSSANTIYAVNESVFSRGLNIAADGIALVVMPGFTLTSRPTLPTADCRPDWPTGDQNCVINFSGRKRFWLEGSIFGISTERLVIGDRSGGVNISRFRMHNLKFESTTMAVLTNSSGGGYYSDIVIKNVGIGLFDNGSWNSVFHDIQVENALKGIDSGWMSYGSRYLNIEIFNSGDASNFAYNASGQNNVLSHFKFHNLKKGIKTEGNRGVLVDGMVSNTSTACITGAEYSMAHLTVANCTQEGINKTGPYRTLHNILTTNNSIGLKHFADYGESYIYGLSAIDNQTREIQIENNSIHLQLKGQVNIGRLGTPCSIGSGTSDLNIVNNLCDPISISSYSLQSNLNANNILNGFVSDSVNSQGSIGIGVLFSAITDWMSFENMKRAWTSRSLESLPNSNLSKKCETGNCSIFDYGIRTSSTLAKQNGTFQANMPCPEITKGSQAMTVFNDTDSKLVLQGVAEFILDGYGNDDGFCDQGEKCYFVENVGSQLQQPWNFTNKCQYDSSGTSLTQIEIFGP